MLQVGVIGCGNAGNQTVELIHKMYPEIPVLALNCSENDMVTISDDVPKKLIGDGKGAGKNRSEAKKFLSQKITDLMSDETFRNTFSELEIVFVVSSAGGGTGSGIALLLSKVMKVAFTKTFLIPVGILPAVSEAYSTQGNSLEYLNELYTLMENPTYMLYDNERGTKLSTNRMMEEVNRQIASDINVLRGAYNISTKYMSIDERDALTLITTPGRIFVASVTDIKEKDLGEITIEDMILDRIKKNYHVPIQMDHVVNRTGVIANLSEPLLSGFDSHLPRVQEVVGSPVEEFEHLSVTPDRKMANHVFFIMSGLSDVNDRIEEINERIREIEEAQRQMEDVSDLDTNVIAGVNSKRIYRASEEVPADRKADVSQIFKDFGVKF